MGSTGKDRERRGEEKGQKKIGKRLPQDEGGVVVSWEIVLYGAGPFIEPSRRIASAWLGEAGVFLFSRVF